MTAMWVARKAQGPEDWNQPHKIDADKEGSEVSSTSNTAQAWSMPPAILTKGWKSERQQYQWSGGSGKPICGGLGNASILTASSLCEGREMAKREQDWRILPLPTPFINTKDFYVSILGSTAIYRVPTTWQAVAGVWDKSVNTTNKHLCHGEVFILVGQWKSLSCLTPCGPMDYTVHGILQARILEWVAMGSSQPYRSNPGLPHCRWILY